jgi:hypothetical protein
VDSEYGYDRPLDVNPEGAYRYYTEGFFPQLDHKTKGDVLMAINTVSILLAHGYEEQLKEFHHQQVERWAAQQGDAVSG